MSRRGDRFKVGDVIAKVHNSPQHEGGGDKHDIGTIVTIAACDGDGLPWFDTDDGRDKDCLDDELWELEVIAHSPLIREML